MIDLSDALETAIYQNLSSGVTLAPVYSVPQEATTPPFAIIADDDVDPTVGDKDGGLEQHTVRIVCIVAGNSKRPLNALMFQVREALHDQPLAAVGTLLSPPVITSSSTRVDPENGVVIGEQSFLIFAQPGD